MPQIEAAGGNTNEFTIILMQVLNATNGTDEADGTDGTDEADNPDGTDEADGTDE